MCGTLDHWSDVLSDTGESVSKGVQSLGNAATDIWHGVSAPITDTPLGRAAATYFTGGLAAPAFAAYDISRGADPLRAAAMGGLGYLGGSGALTGVDGYSIDNLATPEGVVEPGAMADTGLQLPPGAASEAGWSVAPDVLGTSGESVMGTTPYNYSPNMDFSSAPLGTGISGAGGPPPGLEMVTQGGMTPTPTVGQGGELTYNPSDYQTAGPSSLGDYFRGGDQWLKENTGMGVKGWGTGLYDMYRKRQAADLMRKQRDESMNRWQGYEDQINKYYAPGSPEAEMMRQQLERQDARAGRNSQYGQREVDLAARMAAERAKYRTGMAPTQNALAQRAQTYGQAAQGLEGSQYNTLGAGWALGNLF